MKIIKNNYNKIILMYIVLQPIISAISNILKVNLNTSFSINYIIKILFLIITSIYILFINKNKKTKILYLLIILFMILYSINILVIKGVGAIAYEVKSLINTMCFPISLLALEDYLNEDKITLKTIYYVYMLYILLIFFPNITNTGFNSYLEAKVGSIGWFNEANAIGCILSILLPFIIYYIINYKTNIIIKLISIIMIIYSILSIGTKVPVISLILSIFLITIYYIVKLIKQNNKKILLLLVTILTIIISVSIIIMPKTSFYKNLEIHRKYLHLNHYYEVFTKYKYINHFIFSQRLTFLNNTYKNYKKANISEKLLGIGYIENYSKDDVSTKLIEIDYFDIFFRLGIVGTILYSYITYQYIKKFIKYKKENNLFTYTYYIALLLTILLALFSGHVVTSQSVSIYVVIILLYGITNINKLNKIKED